METFECQQPEPIKDPQMRARKSITCLNRIIVGQLWEIIPAVPCLLKFYRHFLCRAGNYPTDIIWSSQRTKQKAGHKKLHCLGMRTPLYRSMAPSEGNYQHSCAPEEEGQGEMHSWETCQLLWWCNFLSGSANKKLCREAVPQQILPTSSLCALASWPTETFQPVPQREGV